MKDPRPDGGQSVAVRPARKRIAAAMARSRSAPGSVSATSNAIAAAAAAARRGPMAPGLPVSEASMATPPLTASAIRAVRSAPRYLRRGAAGGGAFDSYPQPVGPGGRDPGTVRKPLGYLEPLARPVPLREAQTLRALSVAVVVSILVSIAMWFYGFDTYTNGRDLTSDSIHAIVGLAIFVTTIAIVVRWLRSLPRGIMALRREKAGRLAYERASKSFMESNRPTL